MRGGSDGRSRDETYGEVKYAQCRVLSARPRRVGELGNRGFGEVRSDGQPHRLTSLPPRIPDFPNPNYRSDPPRFEIVPLEEAVVMLSS